MFLNTKDLNTSLGSGRRKGRRPKMEVVTVKRLLTIAVVTGLFFALAAPAGAHPNLPGSPVGPPGGTFYANLRRYLKAAGLPLAGVHIFRHSAAKLRREAGESIEDVSRFLDHSSLQVTTTYLRRLEGQEDRSWRKVAAAIGV